MVESFGIGASKPSLRKVALSTDRAKLEFTLVDLAKKTTELRAKAAALPKTKAGRGLKGKIAGQLRGISAVRRTARKRLNNLATAQATGLTVAEVRAREQKSLARTRSDLARKATAEAQRVETEKVAFETRARERSIAAGTFQPQDTVNLAALAARTQTAGALFRELRDRPDVTFTLTREPLAVAVGAPGSFERARGVEQRDVLAQAAAEGRFIGPDLTRGRVGRALLADVEVIGRGALSDFRERPGLIASSLTRRAFVPGPSPRLIGGILTTRLPLTAQARLGADTVLEESIISRAGGFSPEGLRAQASAFRTGLVSSAIGIAAEPVERGLFLGSALIPALRGVSRTGQPLLSGVSPAARTRIAQLGIGRAAGDVVTAGFTLGFIGAQRDAPFGAAAGEVAPFVVPSLLRPSALGVAALGRGALSAAERVGPSGRAGVLRPGRRRIKTLAQRRKESRGQVSFVDTTREARLKKKAVAILRTEINPQGKVIQLQQRGDRVVATELSGRAARRFRRSQTRAGIGKLVELGPEEAVIVQRTTLSKRGARRARQRADRESRDQNLGNLVQQQIAREQQRAIVTRAPTEIVKRVARPRQVGEIRPRPETLTDTFATLFGRRRTRRAIFVEPEPEVIRGGFRPGQREILFERLRLRREQLGVEREVVAERQFGEISLRVPLLPLATSLDRVGITIPRITQAPVVLSATERRVIPALDVSPITAGRLGVIPEIRTQTAAASALSFVPAVASVSRLEPAVVVDTMSLFDSRLESLVVPSSAGDFLRPARPGPPRPRARPPARPPELFRAFEPRRPLRPFRPIPPTFFAAPPFAGGLVLTLPELEKKGVPGFRVAVRRRGVFQLIAGPPLSEESAFVLGATITDRSPAQTFKLLETDELVKPGDSDPSKFALAGLLSKFRPSGERLFREKQKNLIDTAGELRDITFKGIEASARARSQLGRLGI